MKLDSCQNMQRVCAFVGIWVCVHACVFVCVCLSVCVQYLIDVSASQLCSADKVSIEGYLLSLKAATEHTQQTVK